MKFNYIKKKIIIGTWSWSGMYKTISTNEIKKLIKKCISNNFIEFDTSPSYKKADKLLLEFKRKNPKILINTKCGWDLKMKRTYDIDEIKKGIENTLEKFGKIHVLQLHNPRNEIKNWDLIVEMFNYYKKRRLIKFSGISLARNYYFSSKVLNNFDFIQDEFNLLRIDPIKKMKKYNNILAARSIFANGILTDGFKKKSVYQKNDHRSSWLEGSRKENIFMQKEILEKLNKDNIAQFAMNFVMHFELFDKFIFGFRTEKQFNIFLENLKNLKPLNKNIIHKIISLHKNNKYFLNKKLRYNN
ncbi:aldo/keto reductase [Candidatus Pelagibacter sp.]|nr:aldo/keto reductase [Candidatus Pelagibacter sp.]